MKRRDFIPLVGGAAASWPLACAGAAGRPQRLRSMLLPALGLVTKWHISVFVKPKAATRSTVARSSAVGSKAGTPPPWAFLLTRLCSSAFLLIVGYRRKIRPFSEWGTA